MICWLSLIWLSLLRVWVGFFPKYCFTVVWGVQSAWAWWRIRCSYVQRICTHESWLFIYRYSLVRLILSFTNMLFEKWIGQALMAMKGSFSNIADVLLDWDDVHNDDFCSWRGVFCDNVSLTVLSLYALSSSNPHSLFSSLFLFLKLINVIFMLLSWLWSNLSSLNLGGEVSPAIGDLRNLQSMYVTFYYNYYILIWFDLIGIWSLCFIFVMAETCKGIS